MIKATDKGVTPETIEALKAGKTPGQGAETAALAAEEGDYLDFIDQQRTEYKDLLARQSMPEPNAALPRMPPTFEQVSLCAKGGGCRYLFQIVAPVNAKMYDDNGVMRPAMATIRRCLIGAVKLDSDDPVVLSTMKSLATEAPYGVQKCSHWSPYTDDELAVLTDRRLAGQRRDDERISQEKALAAEEARARLPPIPTVDVDADLDDSPEPDFAAPAVPYAPPGAAAPPGAKP